MKYRCCEMTAPEKNYQTSLAHIQTVIRGYLLSYNKTILRHIKYGRQSSRAAPYQHSSWLRHWTSSPKGLPEPPPGCSGCPSSPGPAAGCLLAEDPPPGPGACRKDAPCSLAVLKGAQPRMRAQRSAAHTSLPKQGAHEHAGAFLALKGFCSKVSAAASFRADNCTGMLTGSCRKSCVQAIVKSSSLVFM